MEHQIDPLVDANQAAKMLSVTPKIIWQWTRGKKLDFPEPIRIGTNCTRWRLSEINNWIENRR